MAPIKFEDQLKEKLEERSLQPTEQSWSQLQKQLDDHESKNKSFRFWWIGIAASIIGVILVITQFYKNTEVVEESNVIVNSEVETIKETPDLDKELKPEVLLTTTKESEDDQEDEPPIIQKQPIIEDIKKESIAQNEVIPKTTSENTLVASIMKEDQPELEKIDKIEDISIDQSIIENVVAEVKAEQKSEVPVSNRQIDSLLKEAQKDLLQQKLLDENRQTVSADALLEDIELELEETFRDKLFDALKTNFNSVKTAVANRNN